MAITNGYATLEQLKQFKSIDTPDSVDDLELEAMIQNASRMIDSICNRWFYAYSGTRYYDTPAGRDLVLDADLISITSITNGNGTVLPSSEYLLLPANVIPKYIIRIKASSSYGWELDSSGNHENAITVSASWGFCSRSATDPESTRAIDTTKRACLLIVKQWLNERYGSNTGGDSIITAAGVVQTPAGAIPRSAYEMIRPYIRIV